MKFNLLHQFPKRRIALLAASLLLFLSSQLASALNAPDPTALRSMLQPFEADVHNWQQMATTILVLNVTVGVLGVIVGALQTSQRKLSKFTTAFLGVAISVITVITNLSFDVDRRTLHTRVIQGRELLAECQLMLQRIPEDASNQDAWLGEFGARLQKLAELGGEPEKKAALVDIELIPPVYAQSSKAAAPTWVDHPPSDSSNFYYLGSASDPSLAQAKSLAEKDANRRASAYLSQQLETAQQAGSNLPSATEYVLKSAAQQDSYFTYDPALHTYRYYVLMRVRRDVAENDLKLYSFKGGVSLSPNWSQAVQQAGSSNQYPPAIPPASRHYKVEQGHFVRLDLMGNVGLYVGDVHRAKPSRVVVFSFPEGKPPDSHRRVNDEGVAQQLAGLTVLADRNIRQGDAFAVSAGGARYRLAFNLVWKGLGKDSAEVTVEAE